jgi:N-acetylglucosaminyldiphosphoundecaprenol N-acetyl-beta-D-mannosaminyltransferase
MDQVKILDVPFINTTMNDFINVLEERIARNDKTFVVTANPIIVMKAKEDPEYRDVINNATYITADGIGIIKAAQWLNTPLPERVTGFDMFLELLERANQKHYKIYLLGASETVLKTTISKIEADYPGAEIVGSHNGFFDWENNSIAEEVRELQPDLIFVALGVPKQEEWINSHLPEFEKGIFIGIGGSFDSLVGAVKRAPILWQKMNLEWFYRLIKQPSRWRRMLALPKFAMIILKQKAMGKK